MRNTKYVAEERYTENKLKQEFMQSIRRMLGCGLGELGFMAYEKVQFDAGCGAFCTRERTCLCGIGRLVTWFLRSCCFGVFVGIFCPAKLVAIEAAQFAV